MLHADSFISYLIIRFLCCSLFWAQVRVIDRYNGWSHSRIIASRDRPRSRSPRVASTQCDLSASSREVQHDEFASSVAVELPLSEGRDPPTSEFVLILPQVALGEVDDRPTWRWSETVVRRFARNESLRAWWELRARRYRSGSLDLRALRKWRVAGYVPDATNYGPWGVAMPCHSVVVHEPTERKLWQEWGQPVWRSIMQSAADLLEANGVLSGVGYLDGERGIPPSPYGLPA